MAWLALVSRRRSAGLLLWDEWVAVTLAMMVAAFLLLFLAYWSSVQHDRL